MDDFDRDVFSLLGLPFDVIDMAGAVRRVREAARTRTRCFLTTPNVNFLIGAQRAATFRDTVINSDLCLTDGMSLVWMARLIGVRLRERVAGSDLFEALGDARTDAENRLAVYFFGGPDDVAGDACRRLNRGPGDLVCVGYQSPGFGSVEALSGEARIAEINASGADFLVVALGAVKGQAWIDRNRERITVPVVSHLGAVVNFSAGRLRRAPRWMRRCGLEWLWRIKEEPALWRRYALDGARLARLLLTRLLPYALWLRRRARAGVRGAPATAAIRVHGDTCTVSLCGGIAGEVPLSVRKALREAAERRTALVVDCSRCDILSPRFLGLLLMVQKHQAAAGRALRVTGASAALRRVFRWNGLEALLGGPAPSAVPLAVPATEVPGNVSVTTGA